MTFIIGKKNQLLSHLGIPYGTIFLEYCKPIPVFCLEDAKKCLASGVEQEILTVEEAELLVRQMTEAGVLENLAAICNQATKVELPADFKPSVSFVAHTCDLPVPHGYLKNDMNGKESGVIHSLHDGLEHLDTLVLNKKLHPLDGVSAFKQMKAMNLPLEEEDLHRRFGALPADKKPKVPDFDAIMMIEISGPGIESTLFDFLLRRGARDERRRTHKEG